jgi:N-methylhydantoinase A
VAASLGIREILVPPHPGILCAQGLLVADVSESFVASRRLLVSAGAHGLILEAVKSLVARAQEWFKTEQAPSAKQRLEATLDMRYVGQNYELSVPFDIEMIRSALPADVVASLGRAFRDVHEQHYGTSNDEAAVEIVNIRVTARVISANLPSAASSARSGSGVPKPKLTRMVHFGGSVPVHCPVYDRRELGAGAKLTGPAIIEQLDTTTLLFPRDRLSVDDELNIIIRIEEL